MAMLLLSSCSEELPNGVNESDKITAGEQFENIAQVIASLELGNNEIKKIHEGVSKAIDNGLHETYFLKELLCKDNKIVSSKHQTEVVSDYINTHLSDNVLFHLI